MRRSAVTPAVATVIAATVIAATLIAVTGCASVADTGGHPRSGITVTSPAPAGSGSSVGPAPSVAPTGPAATAATGAPPPMAEHAVAHLGAVTISCPDDPFARDDELATASPLAAKVSVTAVVRCETVDRRYPGLGEWKVQLAEVAYSGFDAFLAQLRKPSRAVAPNVACPDLGYLTPWFVLVQRGGSLLRPSMPSNGCEAVSRQAVAALNGLPFALADAVRTAQTASPESVDSGCAQQWKDIVALQGANAASGTDAGSPGQLASSPSSVLVCLYKAGPMDGGLRVGDLIKGVTATGPVAASIGGTASIVDPLPAGCTDADEFVVIANSAYVELGGCHRLLTSDGRLGAATVKLLAQVASVLGVS